MLSVFNTIVWPGLSSKDVANCFSMASRPSIACPLRVTIRAFLVKSAARALASAALNALVNSETRSRSAASSWARLTAPHLGCRWLAFLRKG